MWKQEIIKRLPKLDHIKALDLGCGPGFASMVLAEYGCEVIGIDYSKKMIEVAKQVAKENGFENIEYIAMDAQNLLFEDSSFDFIFTRNVTWTLPDVEKA